MLSEYITSLADVSFHIVAYMYARFRYSGKNPMRFAVFWLISVRFCGFPTPPPLRPPLYRALYGDAMLVPIRMDTNAAAGNFLLQKRELISRGNHENHERLESIITSRYLT